MHIIQVQNLTTPLSTAITAHYCDSFWSRFNGLMGRPHLDEDEGLVLVDSKDSRADSAIHMLFMKFDIATVWINSKNIVVDVKLARKWYPIYIPQAPARFVLETHPIHMSHFKTGDLVEMKNA
jgi:uncharacterized membrane protein (UPF0127 family)